MPEPSHQTERLLLDKIRAEHRPGVQKDLFTGIRMFQQARRRMIEAIREDFPGADDSHVMRELERRARIAQIIENRPWTN